MRYFLILLATAVGIALSATDAQAGYEFRFANSSGTEMTSFTIAGVSSTVDIRVYLVATGSDATDLQTDGLKSYGVQLNYSGSATAKVVSTSDITNNAAFTGVDGKAIENDGGATDWARSRDSIGTGSVASTTNGSEERILLATFRFTGLSLGDTLVFSADPTSTTDTVLGDNTVIDTLINGQSGTISVVPEPGSMMLCGLAVLGMVGVGYRRLRRKAA
jgi:hypothetical protein